MENKQHATKSVNGPMKDIRENILQIPWDKWKSKHSFPKSTGLSKSSSKREVHSNKGLHQETRKISNNLNVYVKKLEKEEQSPKLVEEWNNKEQSRKNEIETKRKQKRWMKPLVF